MSPRRREAGRHRERIARERAGLIDRPVGRELRHDVGAAAERADRQPAADDLAERREVGRDAFALLRAAARRRESRSSPRRRSAARRTACTARAASAGKPGCGSTRPMLPGYGSTITAAIARRARRTRCSIARRVVERQHDRVARGAFGDAGRIGNAVRQRAGAGRDQKRVAVAVIAAGELHDLRRGVKPRASRTALIVASVPLERSAAVRSTAPSQTISSASSLSARSARRTTSRASPRCAIARVTAGMRVAEDQRAPRHHVVDVLVAVEVVQHRARAALHEDRREPDGAERAHRRVHAAGDDVARARERGDRSFELHRERSHSARSSARLTL